MLSFTTKTITPRNNQKAVIGTLVSIMLKYCNCRISLPQKIISVILYNMQDMLQNRYSYLHSCIILLQSITL